MSKMALNFNTPASVNIFADDADNLVMIRHGDHLLIQTLSGDGIKTTSKGGARRKAFIDAATATSLRIEDKTRYAVEPFNPKTWVKRARWARQLEGNWYRLVRHSSLTEMPRVAAGDSMMVTVGV